MPFFGSGGDALKEIVESDWAWAAEIGTEQRLRSEKFRLINSFPNRSLGFSQLDLSAVSTISFF